MTRASASHASEPLDHVYAVLELADQYHQAQIGIDYDMAPEELFGKVSHFLWQVKHVHVSPWSGYTFLWGRFDSVQPTWLRNFAHVNPLDHGEFIRSCATSWDGGPGSASRAFLAPGYPWMNHRVEVPSGMGHSPPRTGSPNPIALRGLLLDEIKTILRGDVFANCSNPYRAMVHKLTCSETALSPSQFTISISWHQRSSTCTSSSRLPTVAVVYATTPCSKPTSW